MNKSDDELIESVRGSLRAQADRVNPATESFDPARASATPLEVETDSIAHRRRGPVLVAVAAGVVLILVVAGLLVSRGGDVGVETVSAPEPTTVQPLRARLELSETSVPAGTFIDGVVILNNDTGQAFKVDGCGGLYAAGLASDTMQASIGSLLCLSKIDVPEGESRHPVSVRTTYQSCLTAEDRASVTATNPEGAAAILSQPDCVVDPNTPPPPGESVAHQPPPLPAGDYRVEVRGTPGVPTPDPVDVTLTASGSSTDGEGVGPTTPTTAGTDSFSDDGVPVPTTEPTAEPPVHSTPRIDLRYEVDNTTVTAGEPITGKVIATNLTGATVLAKACGDRMPVGLRAQNGIQLAINFFSDKCPETFEIPAGESEWPFTLVPRYLGCTTVTGTGSQDMPECESDGSVPLLPPGPYSVDMGPISVGPDTFILVPEPVLVTIF